MAAGIILTKADIDNQFGGTFRDLNVALENVGDLKAWADQFTAQNLVDNYGYTLADANLLKSAIGDLDQLRTIYQGAASLAVAKDFRAFAKQMYGFGL